MSRKKVAEMSGEYERKWKKKTLDFHLFGMRWDIYWGWIEKGIIDSQK